MNNMNNMNNDYTELSALVNEITGFELPAQAPQIGWQFRFERPNKNAYPADKQTATGVYLGDGRLYLLAPNALSRHAKVTETEEYQFTPENEGMFSTYREKARGHRNVERMALAKSDYFSAEVYEDGAEPIVSEPWMTDYTPEGVMFGELRTTENALIQAFWSMRDDADKPAGYWEVCAYRRFSEDSQEDVCIDETPCAHIHRLKHGAPIIWGCGAYLIERLKQQFPDYSIFEAYKLEHLPELIRNVSGWKYHHFVRVATQIVGVDTEQKQVLPAFESDYPHLIRPEVKQPPKPMVFELQGVAV